MKKRGPAKGNGSKKNGKNGKNGKKHPVLRQKLTFGQRSADIIADFGGSWAFIILFLIFFLVWILINTMVLVKRPFDPYPFILLNLTLSLLSALQAPIILMAQNRQAERDRIQASYDYKVNRKAEREIQHIQKDVDKIIRAVGRKKK